MHTAVVSHARQWTISAGARLVGDPMTGLAENFQGGVATHTTGYTRGEQ